MANLSNTYEPNAPAGKSGSGSAISNREDLLDVLTILAPEETPVLSSANKSKAKSTFVEWTVDGLASPTTDGIGETVDVTFGAQSDKFANRVRLGNYIQKFRRDYMVSDLQDAVDSVGPAKFAQAEAKAIRELKRDVEATLISDNEMAAENGTNPYKLRGLGNWIESDAQSVNPVPSDYRTPDTSIHKSGEGDFSEDVLNNLITSIYRQSGASESLTLVADTALRRKITEFARYAPTVDSKTAIRNVNYEGGNAEIKFSVELYQSDHGVVSVVNMNPDCAPDQTNKDTGYLLNPEYFGVAELIPMGSTRLPNLGAGERGYVDCALTSLVLHPGAHGKITSLADPA
jgi:hypothetical protein